MVRSNFSLNLERLATSGFNATILFSSHAGRMMKKLALQVRSCCWRAVPKSKTITMSENPRAGLAGGLLADQRAATSLVSPEAIGSLIVTKEGDTLIAVSGSG